jgi:microcystin-dependent protein
MSLQNCSNCYNGCTEIVSDKCVRYTGIDVPVLGIQTGDSLSYVEQALITFLTSTLDGTGIKIDLDPATLCEFVSLRLPTCGDITLVDVLNALTDAVCFLKDEVTALNAKFSELEQGYQIECLEGSPDPTSTYEVLQATINKLCQLQIDLTALALDVDTNYVKLADLNALIQAYLNSQSTSENYSNRMVPYTVVEYYGSLANFDASGAGLGTWANIYLCNGQNGTPDKRGRIPVGAIQGVPGLGLNPIVDPTVPGNPNYAIYTTSGANTVTLTTNQIPSHTHNNTVSLIDPQHTHNWGYGREGDDNASGNSYDEFTLTPGLNGGLGTSPVLPNSTGITVSISNAAQGGGQSHNNIPPVLACYYIMYIPAP